MARKLPLLLPSAVVLAAGVDSTPSDVDTGGYDVMIGGHGFRLATDQQFYYSRGTEPTTTHRYDSSLEPGEQSLSPIPWIKSQSSFHAGAGQLNLEQGFTAFQYQAEQVEHIRFDTCQGVDVWTPGKVTRLPATLITSLGGADFSQMITAAVGGFDYAIGGGVHTFAQAKWTAGPGSAPTVNSIDLSALAGVSNCTVTSIVTDGANYYALIQMAANGTTTPAGVRTVIVKGDVSSVVAPTIIYKGPATSVQWPGTLGWAKARLVAGLNQSLYELQTAPTTPPVDLSTLTAKYTHPSSSFSWTCFSESPVAILAAGNAGRQSTVLEFALDTSGAVPTLAGGAVVAVLPPGELIYSLGSMLGSFLSIGTSQGLRIGTFDTYTGRLALGPISVTSTQPILSTTGRDRFVYAGHTNQQPDGKTGLVRLDLSFTVDAAGRLAWAPDLRPPDSAATGLGAVQCVGLLPLANRLIFVAADGLHVEQAAPNGDANAWLRTSRIRYSTAEMKLFKAARVTGTLDSASITVTGITPFGGSTPLGTFGFLTDGNPGEFGLPGSTHEWIQMQFALNGATCQMGSYYVKAYPAPARQRVITLTVNCFSNETDRYGLAVSDPETTRKRLQNLEDLEDIGDEVRYVEFTNQGAQALIVLIDQLEYKSFSRPNVEDDFGGYITLRLRLTGD